MSVEGFDETVLELMPAEMEMHDAIICATAIAWRDIMIEETAVITKDRNIRASGVIRTVW